MFSVKPNHYLVLAWSLVICIISLSLLPGGSIPKYSWLDFLAIDKIGHFIFYGSTAWSFLKYFKLQNQKTSLWKIGIPLFFLGVLLESLQYFLHQGRSFDLFDVLANSLGVICGLRCFDFVFRIFLKGK